MRYSVLRSDVLKFSAVWMIHTEVQVSSGRLAMRGLCPGLAASHRQIGRMGEKWGETLAIGGGSSDHPDFQC